MKELPRDVARIIESAERLVKDGEDANMIYSAAAAAIDDMELSIDTHSLALARLAEAVRKEK